MTDGLPTESDIHAADQMFGIGEDQFDNRKMAHEIARHKRICSEQSASMTEVITCLKGDKFGQNIGMIEEQKRQGNMLKTQGDVLDEVHKIVTQKATTMTHRPSDALEKNTKNVHMIMGGLVVLGFIANAVIALL